MRLRAIVLAVGAALAVAGTAEAAWYNPNWAYRTQLTINGALVPAAQSNFPVLVAWTADAKLAAGAQANGNDILFTAADGTTKLDHEIESYTPATGALAAWVRVPALASGSNTTIYMYYGNAGAASQQNKNGVWDANFRGVWHLSEAPANGVAGHFDSTSDNFTGTPQGFNDGTPGTTNAVGIVAKGDTFLTDAYVAPCPGAGNCVNRVEVPDNAALRPNGDFTVEAWANFLSPAFDQHLVYKLDGGNFAYQLLVGSAGGRAAFQRYPTAGPPGVIVNGTTVLLASTWYHIVGVKSGANLLIYVNGVLEGTTGGVAGNIYATAPQQFVIGATYWGSGGLNGTEDEVRFSDTARPATWLKTEYNNLTNQGVGAGKFLLDATSETLPTTAIYYSVGTNAAALYGPANASATNGTLTLSSAAANNVGVGDEIRVGANRYYITGRMSSTVFTIQNSHANGGTPGATNITFATQAISIYRAFNSLAAAHTGTGDTNHLNTNDLTGAAGYQLNWPCYADGALASVNISTFQTAPAQYLRVYTPESTSEVGVSQRHTGVFGTGVQVNGTNTDTIRVANNYVRIEGLTVLATVNTAGFFGGIMVTPGAASPASDVRISHNIVKGNVTDAAGIGAYGIGLGNNASDVARVWDNVVYNFPVVTGSYGLGIFLDYGTAYVSNNTVFDCRTGIYMEATAVAMRVQNNVSINDVFNPANFVDYSAAAATRSNNVSSDTTSETAALRSKTAYATYFKNTTAGSEDLHLRASSLTLWGSNGVDLSTDGNLPVTDDIDGALRVRPDIGADEFSATPLFRSVGITATALASGTTNGLTISGSIATFASALPDNIGVGDAIQYDSDGNGTIDAIAFILGRTSSQVYTVKSKTGGAPTPVTGDNDWAIYRAYTSLFNWEAQGENGSINAAVRDFDTSTDLRTSNTTMNVACYGDGADTTPVTVAGWTTGIDNYIRIYTPAAPHEVGRSQRHSGTWNATTAYRLQAALGANGSLLWLQANYVRVDGLQFWLTNDVFYPAVLYMNGASGVSSYQISNNIVRGNGGASGQPGRIGINVYNGGAAGSVARIWNNLVYDFTGPQATDVAGILPDDANFTSYIYNNTVVDNVQGIAQYQGTVVAKNNLAYNNTDNYVGTFDAASTNNLSGPSQSDAPGTSPRNAATVTFVNAAGDDFHLAASDAGARDQGRDLSGDASLAFSTDIDRQVRQVPWDIGVDDASGTTAVELMFFSAVPGDGSVTLKWQTGSELDNLGFHVYRGPSGDGPWTRLTSSLIPGLGSSPLGQAYSWLDTGLVNGTTYYYRLEDVDTSSRSTFHGPVSAVPGTAPVPAPSSPGGDGGGGGGGAGAEGGGPGPSSCPSWVLAAAPDAASPVCTRHGEPESTSLQVLSRDSSTATLELRTGGFWTLQDASGTVRVFVPGLEFPSDPRAPALPLRRALVEAVVGKGVELVSAEAYEPQTFRGLRPSAVGAKELVVHRDGTVLPARRSLGAPVLTRGNVPREVARLAGTVFQGESKSAVVEMTPVRFSGSGLVLARRVRVTLAFKGVVEGVRGTGSRGRVLPRRMVLADVLAQLYTSQRGLHAVTFEALFPGRARGFSTRSLRLQRQGEAVPFHVEPRGSAFAPGSTLYFYGDRAASSTDYSSEVAYELVRSLEGSQMSLGTAAAAGAGVGSSSMGFASFETNRIYQPGLVEAPDVWLWQAALSTAAAPPPVSFVLGGVDTASAEGARLSVFLQGGSESGVVVDHHVRVMVNGVEVGEATFAGKKPYLLEAAVPASVLKEGANELSVVNVGDTGVYSLVFLDRFEVSYAQASLLRDGVFEGVWAEGGVVEVGGVTGPVVILRDARVPGPEGRAVTWLTGYEVSGSSVRFEAEAGHRYLVVSPEGLLSPRVERVAVSTLRDRANQADYLVIGPREFLEAATPLVERRRSQGLTSRVVAFEEIASEFGHGQPSAEAIKSFLSYAYHSWRRPSPRYVLLLGDSTDDPQRFLSSSWPSPLPALFTKTSYLWTASDPALAAVNGEDALPDLAIGRLPATTVEQAESLVAKVLAWEEAGQGLAGNAVLVADKPDQGGDFEWDVEDVRSSFLFDRAATTLRVRELGGGARPAILDSFDEGSSLMSYVGHGGTAVWSSANVLNTWDAASLLAQSRQPVLMTMNCLNGYFVAPNFDALPEALLKAEGRGVIAAVSPSGLSLDGPAHEYHRALMAELTSGRHERLGDAILAAQKDYAQTGLMPELLTVYQLLGDPALRIR